ncbi:LCP family protein [Streptomyces zagrosensis]|uniref:LCP family protein required for cell wall assembly n=1 Tax=Streptomyces zagrosensis TaxID=1042984 RepID=A0A7W9QFL2_9ACTN|nr:LCP family protein [Streptomyces zagrosensis]MBB5939094.1 LCP family protein required for cell wall assembly [Streptomyces zagrosensis]
MRHGGRRGERSRRRVPEARELGWDDGLYAKGGSAAARSGAAGGHPVPAGGQPSPGTDRDGNDLGHSGPGGHGLPADGRVPAPGAGPRGGRRRAREADDTGNGDGSYGSGVGAQRGAPAPGSGARGGAASGQGGAVPVPRSGGGTRRAGTRRRVRQQGKGRRILLWTAGGLSLVILGTAGAGYLYYQHLNGNIEKDVLNLGEARLDKSTPNAHGQTPLNILLLGSDSRNTEENVKLGGSRADADRKPLADVQMLLHVSADRSNMSVVSIPRDTRVTIPKCTDDDGTIYPESDRNIINSSLQNGGPGCTVATWEALSGVPIDHFMMIDFAGVVDMADAVGGVPVCVDNNVKDPDSGLRLEKGEKEIKGEQALQWLRTRHGFEDGSDIGRAKAQHMYMNAMVRQLKSGSKLTDPGKLMDLAESATKALKVDYGLGTVKKLYNLGNELKRVPTKRITMTTMPWVPDPQSKAHVVPDPNDADKLFELVRNDIALDGKDKKKLPPKKTTEPTTPSAPKGEIAVAVQNGTGTVTEAPVPQRATIIADALLKNGFNQAIADTTPKPQAKTTVTYATEEQRGNALTVATSLGLPKDAVQLSPGLPQVTVIVGADWREGTTYPKPTDSQGSEDGGTSGDTGTGGTGGTDDAAKDEKRDEDAKVPDSAGALNGDDKTACMKVNPAYTF